MAVIGGVGTWLVGKSRFHRLLTITGTLLVILSGRTAEIWGFGVGLSFLFFGVGLWCWSILREPPRPEPAKEITP